MCVATPMKVVSIDGPSARVSASGVELEVGIELVDEVAVGDYVIVHAGYAIARLDPDEAEETLALLERLQEIDARLREPHGAPGAGLLPEAARRAGEEPPSR